MKMREITIPLVYKKERKNEGELDTGISSPGIFAPTPWPNRKILTLENVAYSRLKYASILPVYEDSSGLFNTNRSSIYS